MVTFFQSAELGKFKLHRCREFVQAGSERRSACRRVVHCRPLLRHTARFKRPTFFERKIKKTHFAYLSGSAELKKWKKHVFFWFWAAETAPFRPRSKAPKGCGTPRCVARYTFFGSLSTFFSEPSKLDFPQFCTLEKSDLRKGRFFLQFCTCAELEKK